MSSAKLINDIQQKFKKFRNKRNYLKYPFTPFYPPLFQRKKGGLLISVCPSVCLSVTLRFRAITATNVNHFFSNLVTRLNALRARPSSIVTFGGLKLSGVMAPYLTQNVVSCCFRAITATNVNMFFSNSVQG